ncbi:MAG: DUF3368 domain-containing protein [Acidobacteriota bacterium]
MKETWVVNASPLISLAKIGRLDLLREAERELLIPAAVATEILAGPADDPASVALTAGELPDPVPSVSRIEVVEWGLGAGETAVLSQALDRGATAVIDDGEARTAARSLGVRFIGTLGVVIRARKEGRILPSDVLLFFSALDPEQRNNRPASCVTGVISSMNAI